MTEQELKDMQAKCAEAEKINKLIERLESDIKVLNAEMSHFQGDKDLMVRDKWNSIIPTSVFPYTPTDDELIALGTFIQSLYKEKLTLLRKQLKDM